MIGIFDSGLGGLTVLKAVMKKKPEYGYIYLGDSARSPYGDKTAEEIYDCAKGAVSWLFRQGAGLVILACNTASARALRRIQREWLPRYGADKRVLGVIIPVAEAAAAKTRRGRIGVIGTRATINAKAYEAELRKAAKRLSGSKLENAGGRRKLEIYGQSCPLLVPLVEEGLAGRPETRLILNRYLRFLKQKKIDTLIMGCTHYPFLKKDIASIMGGNCWLPDTAAIAADKLALYLERHPEIESRLSRSGRCRYFTTGDPAQFRTSARKFLNNKKITVQRTEI